MEGTPFGRYRLIELLGRGGMGEVWRAHDTDTDRIVAIKVLPAHFSDNEDFKRRFRREAHAAARLNSPHVIPIHNYGEIDGRLYVDMRLIEGRDLQTVLADGPLEPARAVRIIEGVALALHAAHKVGLLHRDVKPSNILLDENDFAYLIDFGIARAADETRLTKSGNTIGTFQYIAPERLGTRAVEDARADIYSLACVLYECLTGQPPFADADGGLVAAHLNTPPPQPSTTHPDVPAQFDAVIGTGMAKDPDERYATTKELAEAARAAVVTERAATSTEAKHPAPAERPGRRPTSQVKSLPAPPRPKRAEEAARSAPPNRASRSSLSARREFIDSWKSVRAWQKQSKDSKSGLQEWTAREAPMRATTSAPQSLPWWQRKAIVIPVAVSLVVAVAVLLIVQNVTSPKHVPPSSEGPPKYDSQRVLAFTGLSQPAGVAVDGTGTVYVADYGNHRVMMLAARSSSPTVLPFSATSQPAGVAVDGTGTVYVADYGNHQVIRLAAGFSSPTIQPARASSTSARSRTHSPTGSSGTAWTRG